MASSKEEIIIWRQQFHRHHHQENGDRMTIVITCYYRHRKIYIYDKLAKSMHYMHLCVCIFDGPSIEQKGYITFFSLLPSRKNKKEKQVSESMNDDLNHATDNIFSLTPPQVSHFKNQLLYQATPFFSLFFSHRYNNGKEQLLNNRRAQIRHTGAPYKIRCMQ